MLHKVFLDSEIEIGATFRSMAETFRPGDNIACEGPDGSVVDGKVLTSDANTAEIRFPSTMVIYERQPLTGTWFVWKAIGDRPAKS